MLHIDLPTRAEIENLARHRGDPSVSIYLRTTPVTLETQADRIELKNLLRTAVEQMQAAGTAKRTVAPIEDAVRALIDDDDFWVDQARSLAVFASEERVRTFRLPNHLQNMVEVSDRYHLKPLLRAVSFPHDAYVLAISMGSVRLVEVSAELPPHPVQVPGLPRDAQAALGRRSIGPRGEMVGHEAGSEHAQLARYGRAVDAALRGVLAGHERPLIVAAAEPMASVAKSVLSYPHVADAVIQGNADHTPDHELAEAARGVLDGIYAMRLKEVAALYDRRLGDGRATGDMAQAARAATFGAVHTLVFDMDAVVPGTVDAESGAVTFAEAESATSYGVVDEIAGRALLAGGTLLAVRRDEVPGGGELAAILRYPV